MSESALSYLSKSNITGIYCLNLDFVSTKTTVYALKIMQKAKQLIYIIIDVTTFCALI